MDMPVFEVLPRDLSPYKAGNVGIDYVHRFESGRPGPHVLINALTHGNEFCGMTAATYLLDRALTSQGINIVTMPLPNRTSGMPKRQSSEASVRSQATASSIALPRQ